MIWIVGAALGYLVYPVLAYSSEPQFERWVNGKWDDVKRIDPWAVLVMAASAGLVVGFGAWLTELIAGSPQALSWWIMGASAVVGVGAAAIGILGGSKIES